MKREWVMKRINDFLSNYCGVTGAMYGLMVALAAAAIILVAAIRG